MQVVWVKIFAVINIICGLKFTSENLKVGLSFILIQIDINSTIQYINIEKEV